MKRGEFREAFEPLLARVQASIPKLLDLNTCLDCGKTLNEPRYMWVKLAICPNCDRIIHAGSTDAHRSTGYESLR